MEKNKVKIVTYKGKTQMSDQLLLNGKDIGYVTDYQVVKGSNELSSVTITFDCHNVEIVEYNADEAINNIGIGKFSKRNLLKK